MWRRDCKTSKTPSSLNQIGLMTTTRYRVPAWKCCSKAIVSALFAFLSIKKSNLLNGLPSNSVLGQLVRLSANDRLAGSQAEVVRLFASLIILLEEKFLSRQAVHKPLVRLMRICVGDEFYTPGASLAEEPEDPNEDEERKAWRRFGRNGSAEVLGFEEDLVDMMCHVASRLRNTPELLIIFFRERKRDAEARRAFDAAVSGSSAGSTRASSPAGTSTPSSSTFRGPTSPLAITKALSPPSSTASSEGGRGGQLTYDFPLFSYLLRFVHRESRTGELARAGLLFLVDVALAPGRRNLSRGKGPHAPADSHSSRLQVRGRGSYRGRGGMAGRGSGRIEVDLGPGPSVALARYMLESDFAEVLGAGLGAVYGLLPSKLALVKSNETGDRATEGRGIGGQVLSASGSMLLGAEETGASSPTEAQLQKLAQQGIEASTGAEVRRQARLVADILEFTQDILRTSTRVHHQQGKGASEKDAKLAVELANIARELTKSIGSALQTLFLRNILYPSLLECSDADGSAVAVMSYLDVILSVIEDDSPLADFVIGWLVGMEEEAGKDKASKIAVTEAPMKPKRKSTAMLQIENEARASGQDRATYFSDALGRYGLRDVVKDHLAPSTSAASKTAALRLANTLSAFHGRFALSFFFDVIPDELATSFPSNIIAARLVQDAPGAETPRDEVGNNEDEGEEDSEEDFLYPGSTKEEVVRHEKLAHLPRLASANISVAQHAVEMDLYLSLVSAIGHGNASQEAAFSSTGFENYLSDAEEDLVRDSIFIDGLRDLEDLSASAPVKESLESTANIPSRQSPLRLDKADELGLGVQSFKHKVNAQDQLMRTLLATFACFFEHPPDVNVALAGLLSSLALCPFRSLEGFLVFSPTFSEGTTEVMQEAADLMKPRPAFDPDDDRSDDEMERSTHRPMTSWPPHKSGARSGGVLKGSKTKRKKQTAPIVLALLRSLAKQVDIHRSEIQDFDRLLDERRRGLLYVENLNEALNLAGIDSTLHEGGEKENGVDGTLKPSLVVPSHDMSAERLWESIGIDDPIVEELSGKKSKAQRAGARMSLPPPPSATPSQGLDDSLQGDADGDEEGISGMKDAKEDAKSSSKKDRASGFSRFFGRPARKVDPSSANASQTSAAKDGEATTLAPVMPFVEHYRQTRSILVEPRVARISKKSPWSLQHRKRETPVLATQTEGKIKRTRFRSHVGSDEDDEQDAEDEEFKYPGADDDDDDYVDNQRGTSAGGPSHMVTLSSLLDNVVILEETIKELAAIIQVRRAWGIDSIQFV